MFLNCFLLVFLFGFCTCNDTITINQAFTDGDVLVSREGNFTFGFFCPGNSSLRYVGIWFHQVPLQTVVWVANRDNPINGSSGVISINQHGNLVLYDNYDQKSTPWSTNISVAGPTVAQLLDSGNLVLVQTESKRVVWQSFDYPTDTILSGMKIGLDKRSGLHRFITSWKSADDPGTGEYSYKLNTSGGHSQYFLFKGCTPYWRSIALPWITYRTDDYTCYLVTNEEEHYFSCLVNTSAVVRIQVDNSGSLRRFRWQNNQWNEFWSVPKYRCDKYGVCGAFSKCNGYNDERFQCACLPGYEPKFPSKWYMRDGSGGCVRKQKGMPICKKGEGFVKLTDVVLPDTSVAQVGMSMSGKECKQACLANCSCAAYASLELSERSICLMWYGELMDIADKVSDGYDIYVRVAENELAENERNSENFLDRRRIRAILVASIVSSWLILMILVYMRHRKIKERKTLKRNWKRLFDRGSSYYGNSFVVNEHEDNRNHEDIVFFTPNAIFAATNNFSPANKIGEGGFGSVYKGQLSNGREVAVKKLSRNSEEGIEEFKNELLLIAKLQHRNLVKIIGCCIQGEEPILIYEYLPNRSLDSFLFDETRKTLLDWIKRFNIIVGVARGLLYLHHDSRVRIVHRDLKSSNILLDADMNPKISDFGTARIVRDDQHKTKRVVGTYGYMSPEYAVMGKFSVKSDVFSFGVILMEIISSKKRNELCQEDTSQSLIGHVWELWREGRALEIVDSSMNLSQCSHEALRCIQIGLLCVQEDAKDRPFVSEVVLMLNGKTPLPSPKQPPFMFREYSENAFLATRERGAHSVNEVTISAILTR